MQRALLIAAALVGMAAAQSTPSGGSSHPTPDPAMESAMSATCSAMEGFWGGLSTECREGVQSRMRQPTVKISDIKSQIAGYVGTTCPASSANLTALEAAINNSISVATNAVQSNPQLTADAKALITQMMQAAQNQDSTPIGLCAAEITLLKGADPNVSEAIIKHMMMQHRPRGGPHGGAGGPGSAGSHEGGAGGSTPAGGSPPTPPSGVSGGSPPPWAGGAGGAGGASAGVASWL